MLPVVSAGVALTSAEAVDLPAGQARRPDGQRPECGHPDRARLRGRDGLCPAARRAVPGGAAPTPRIATQAMRVALRRASPAIIASASTVILGLLCLVFAETNSTKGLGSRGRHRDRRRSAVDDHVAPCAPRDRGPLDVLARPPEIRIAGAHAPPAPGRAWAAASLGTPAASGSSRPFCSASWRSVSTTLHAERAHQRPVVPGEPRARWWGRRSSPRHFPAGVGTPVIVIAHARGAGRRATSPGAQRRASPAVATPVAGDGLGLPAGNAQCSARQQGGICEWSSRCATRSTGRRSSTPRSAATPPINLDVERAAAHDRDLIIPVVLLVVFAILALLLRALVAPLLLYRHGRALVPGRPRRQRLGVQDTCSDSPGRTPPSPCTSLSSL